MISKIYHIQSVGKFAEFTTKEPIELGKLTLIFGDNGSGKSTLADIFRSLSVDESQRLFGRRTLVSKRPQAIHLELEDGTPVEFKHDSWTRTFEEILVFDEVFVNENIYAGNVVSTDHTRNMVDIIIGKVAVKQQETADSISARIETLKVQVGELDRAITEYIHYFRDDPSDKPTTLQFVKLDCIPEIDSQIQDQESTVRQLRDDDRIFRVGEFQSLTLPELPTSQLENLLQESLTSIGDEAEKHVTRYIDKYENNEFGDWLALGTKISNEHPETCPYCKQPISNVDIIKHYRSYFDDRFQRLRERIESFSDDYLDFSKQINACNQNWGQNNELVKTVSAQIPELTIEAIDINEVWASLEAAKRGFQCVLNVKRQSLGIPVPPDAGYNSALKQWECARETAEKYNDSLNDANDRIARKQETLGALDLDGAERTLQELRNTKSRQMSHVACLCDDYVQVSEELSKCEADLTTVRREIDAAIDQSFPDTVKRVNKQLVALGAEFKIASLNHRRDRKSIRLEAIDVELQKQDVSVMNGQNDVSKPSFKNLLSEGDRRTLALAFFLAQLEALPSLKGKIIVFDDPVTSMDDNRRMLTTESIDKLRVDAKQVIVLSHRRRFLYTFFTQFVRSKIDKASTKLLKVCSQSGNPEHSSIQSWGVDDAANSEVRRRYSIVYDFVFARADHSPIDVAGHLRFLLENYFESLYPDVFLPGTSLGAWINRIQNSTENDPMYVLRESVEQDVKYFNILSRTTNHPTFSEFQPNDVRAYCRRVSKMIGREISSSSQQSTG